MDKSGKPTGEPEEWEHPLFMSSIPSEDHPEYETVDAISSLIYDGKTPEELGEHFKEQVSLSLVYVALICDVVDLTCC